MSSKPMPGMRWRIFVKNLESQLCVGIHDHEKKAQKIIVNAHIEGTYSSTPALIEDCFNYDYIYRRVVKEWPSLPHVPLLEMLVIDLLTYIFKADNRVEFACVSIAKSDIFLEAEAVGVEAQWTKEDFLRHTAGL